MDNGSGNDAMTYYFHSATLLILSFISFQLAHLGRQHMSTQAAVDQVTAQLKKVQQEVIQVRDELAAKLADVQTQLEDAKVADVVDLSELIAVAQALDDIVPDDEEATEEVTEEATPEV